MWTRYILLLSLCRVHDLPCPCLTRRHLELKGALILSAPIYLPRKPVYAVSPTHTSADCPTALGTPPHLRAAYAWGAVHHLPYLTHSQSFRKLVLCHTVLSTPQQFVTLSLGLPEHFVETSVRELITVL